MKRDLSADLAICDATFNDCGWCTVGSVIGDDDFRYVVDVSTDYGHEPVAYTVIEQYARFIAEARAGWPEAIRRAIAAEAEVERLRAVLERIGSATMSQFVDIPHMVAELKMTANRALRAR